MLLLHEQNLSPEAIVEAVSSILHGAGSGCNATFEGAYGGDEYHVFRVSFSDMPSVCLRVEHARHEDAPQAILDRVEGERRMYERLGKVDFHWSTRLVGASLSFANPIGYPFLVLDFAGEERLRWTDEVPRQPARAALLRRLAEIHMQLVQRTLETRDMTAYEYFEQKIQRRLTRIRQGNLPELAEQDVLDQLALLPRVLGQDRNNRLFAMEHGDLKAESIISSGEQFTIEAIVDWGTAEMVPIMQAARLPPLLRCESADDVPTETMLRDRESYVAVAAGAAAAGAATASAGKDTSAATAAAAMRKAQGGLNVDFRTLYLESIKSEGMLASMARAGWRLPYSELGGED
ncbi:hypothetical protein BB8028_0003g01770 [Beauveria bassiana]|uniref:Uncharacterized protein n=1 Tax=Beauveria bassiana TaxID=176275 RepID=A0A2S7Y6R9_BEABA|nr:hypothetical protein BB8028_0003g01770 [Beauveria bassiana]